MDNSTHSTNGQRHSSFQAWFRNVLRNGGSASVFVDEGDTVYSMSFSARRMTTEEIGDLDIPEADRTEVYEIDSVGWQEECVNAGFHNVCNTCWRRGDELNHPGIMVYDLSNDEILVDPFLGDKYDDGSEGWASYKLEDLFEQTPSAPEHEAYDR